MARRGYPEINPLYLIILAFLCVSSLVSCLWFFIEKTKIYQEFTQKVNWLSDENKVLSLKIDKAEEEKIVFTQQLKILEDKIQKATQEKSSFSDKISSLMQENQNFSSQLQGLNQEKIVLEKKINELQSDTFLTGLIKEKVSLEAQLLELKQNLQLSQPSLQGISLAQTNIDTRLNEIIQAKVKMEEALKAERNLSQSLSQQLLEQGQEQILVKAEKETIQKSLDETKKEQDNLHFQLVRATADLEILKKEKESLYGQLTLLNQTIGTKTQALEAMTSALDKMPDAPGYSSAIQLPPVIVRADNKMEWALPTSPGEVISIDKKHDFVIINLGAEDGLRPGLIFKITRNDQEIAEVQVIQTRNNVAACDIKELKPGYSINKDDQVILSP